MKAIIPLLLLATCAYAAPLAIDAGLSYVSTSESAGLGTLISSDQDTVSPHVGIRAEISKTIGVRLAYQFIGGLRAHVRHSVGPTFVGRPSAFEAEYTTDIHVISLGAPFVFELRGPFSGGISPEVNWITERQSVSVGREGTIREGKSKLSAGGAAFIRYQIDNKWSLDGGYRYIYLDQSVTRNAHAFFLGVGVR